MARTIACVANVLSAIKLAKWYEMGENDVVLTVLTDSMELYGSRLEELRLDYNNLTTTSAIQLAQAHHLPHLRALSLRGADLYDGRDLRPTTDLRSVFKGVLAEHLARLEASWRALMPSEPPDLDWAAVIRETVVSRSACSSCWRVARISPTVWFNRSQRVRSSAARRAMVCCRVSDS